MQGSATALQPVISTAGYILPTSTLDMERLGCMPSNGNLPPLDVSFKVDQSHTNDTTASCPYDSVGANLTCISTAAVKPLIKNSNVKDQVTATAD